MKQFRVSGIDNRTNKPLQALVEANDEAHCYIVARSRFSSIEKIEKMTGSPGAAPARAKAEAEEPDIDLGETDEDDDDDDLPDLSTFDVTSPTRQPGGLRGILRKYQGQKIGINIDEPDKFRVAKLVAVADDYFSVHVEGGNLLYHFQIRGVISAMEKVQSNPNEQVKQPALFIEVPRTMIFRGVMASMSGKP
ncbi:MAG: hypothetical protein NTW19_14210 [Planctomycetota bacterium]|nr:hypothetical protein [Planctomycetota bacterium]